MFAVAAAPSATSRSLNALGFTNMVLAERPAAAVPWLSVTVQPSSLKTAFSVAVPALPAVARSIITVAAITGCITVACSPAAARWLVATGAKAVGFDCFPERSAKKQSYLPSEFVVHEIIGEAGAILMQTLTNLAQLPAGERFLFFGAFLKVKGGEGAPARFFAVLD